MLTFLRSFSHLSEISDSVLVWGRDSLSLLCFHTQELQWIVDLHLSLHYVQVSSSVGFLLFSMDPNVKAAKNSALHQKSFPTIIKLQKGSNTDKWKQSCNKTQTRHQEQIALREFIWSEPQTSGFSCTSSPLRVVLWVLLFLDSKRGLGLIPPAW